MNDENLIVQKRINELENYMKSTGDYSEKIVNEITILKKMIERNTIEEKEIKETIKKKKEEEIEENKTINENKKNQTFAEKLLEKVVKNNNDKTCEHFFMPTMMAMGENYLIVVCSKCLELRKIGGE